MWIVCADWRDPLNVGAAFRLADAAGLAGLVLGGSTPQPPHPKIAKTARSTQEVVKWQTAINTTGYLREQKSKGALILALEITDNSKSLFDFSFSSLVVPTVEQPVYLIAGNEAHGVSKDLLDLCDDSVHLPMHGRNTSMNVSVAMGAAVYLLLQHLQ